MAATQPCANPIGDLSTKGGIGVVDADEFNDGILHSGSV
jgi:hypothetical protein